MSSAGGQTGHVAMVSEAVVRELVGMADAMRFVEEAFRSIARGEVTIFPPLMCHGLDPSQRFGVKAATDRSSRLLGLKIGSYWPENREAGRSAHGSTTVIVDGGTGLPSAFVGATYLTALRTAAADAIAVHHLARSASSTLAIIGAGHQAFYDFLAIRLVREVSELLVWDRNPGRAEAFAQRARKEGVNAQAAPVDSAVGRADILVTATSAREPLVFKEWVKPGTHISAMGADGRGKQELDTRLVAAASLFAELPEQALQLGECQHAFSSGEIDAARVRPIGAVLEGHIRGRQSEAEITIFDSSGVAAQDLGLAQLALARARDAGLSVEGPFHG